MPVGTRCLTWRGALIEFKEVINGLEPSATEVAENRLERIENLISVQEAENEDE